ncbi:hypothetical protein AKJ16_DCAP26688 [Drosera capensis]
MMGLIVSGVKLKHNEGQPHPISLTSAGTALLPAFRFSYIKRRLELLIPNPKPMSSRLQLRQFRNLLFSGRLHHWRWFDKVWKYIIPQHHESQPCPSALDGLYSYGRRCSASSPNKSKGMMLSRQLTPIKVVTRLNEGTYAKLPTTSCNPRMRLYDGKDSTALYQLP